MNSVRLPQGDWPSSKIRREGAKSAKGIPDNSSPPPFLRVSFALFAPSRLIFTRTLLVLVIASIVLTVSQPLLAQSPDSAQKLQDESLESIPIGPDATATTTQKSPQATVAPSAFDMTRVIIALAAVIALIFLLKAGARRIFPATATHRGASAVKIIGRTTIAPRQHLLILQFGKRLLLVGDSAGRLNPLCEVSDPEEVTAVLTQARDQSISISRRFDSIFGRARKDFDQVEENPAAEPFDPSTEIPADNPTVGEAQKELADLHEKVREVARQIGSA